MFRHNDNKICYDNQYAVVPTPKVPCYKHVIYPRPNQWHRTRVSDMTMKALCYENTFHQQQSSEKQEQQRQDKHRHQPKRQLVIIADKNNTPPPHDVYEKNHLLSKHSGGGGGGGGGVEEEESNKNNGQQPSTIKAGGTRDTYDRQYDPNNERQGTNNTDRSSTTNTNTNTNAVTVTDTSIASPKDPTATTTTTTTTTTVTEVTVITVEGRGENVTAITPANTVDAAEEKKRQVAPLYDPNKRQSRLPSTQSLDARTSSSP